MIDEGEEQQPDWGSPVISSASEDDSPSSPSFAPVGRPTIKKRFRSKIPDPLRLDVPRSRTSRLGSLQLPYSVRSLLLMKREQARYRSSTLTASYLLAGRQTAVVSRIDRADNLKFIEQFRYTIVASQLLSGHSIAAQNSNYLRSTKDTADIPPNVVPTSTGLLATAAGALVVAWAVSWVYSGGYAFLTKRRVAISAAVLVGLGLVSHVYIRQQWIRYLRNQTLAEVTAFVSKSQDFDGVSSAALLLIQEVELVSRGYRM